MTNDKTFDIALLGHFSIDRNIVNGIEAVQSGGAVYYGAMPVARLGLRAAAITKTAEKDLHLLQPMRDAGVAVFPIISHVTTGIQNRYLDASQERRVCTPIAFAGAYKINELPDIEWKTIHVAGLIRGETDLELLKSLAARPGRLSADAQGFVRAIRGNELVSEDWPEKRDALPLLDFFKTDAAEAEILTGETDVNKAADILASWGAKEVLLTHPGGLLVQAEGVQNNFPFTTREMRGRTGRGDTTTAAYLSRRLTHSPADSGRFAAALVSLKMEAQGPSAGTLDDVLQRMDEQNGV